MAVLDKNRSARLIAANLLAQRCKGAKENAKRTPNLLCGILCAFAPLRENLFIRSLKTPVPYWSEKSNPCRLLDKEPTCNQPATCRRRALRCSSGRPCFRKGRNLRQCESHVAGRTGERSWRRPRKPGAFSVPPSQNPGFGKHGRTTSKVLIEWHRE